MAFIQQLGSLRSPVSTYANLPITGNVLGDLRIITDLGVLYTWTSESSSGDLTNWKKVTVSSYNDLVGRPSSTPLAIDDAVQSIRNVMMNYILLYFHKIIADGLTVQKMVGGLLDIFQNTATIDETKSQNYLRIEEDGINAPNYFYIPTGHYDNMTLQSSGFEADKVPTSARIVLFQDYSESNPQVVLPNTDINAYVSRDSGTTFTEITLLREMNIPVDDGAVNFYVGTVDLDEKPNGKEMVWKIITHNNVGIRVRGVSLQWA